MNSGTGAFSTPRGLAASAAGDGVIRVSFESLPDADHEIWRRHGDTVDWYPHATTRDLTFEDRDVKPGQYYEYKVRAVRGDSVSEFEQASFRVEGVEQSLGSEPNCE